VRIAVVDDDIAISSSADLITQPTQGVSGRSADVVDGEGRRPLEILEEDAEEAEEEAATRSFA